MRDLSVATTIAVALATFASWELPADYFQVEQTIATDSGAYTTAVLRYSSAENIVDRGTRERALDSVCSGRSSHALVVRLGSILETPPCAGLEHFNIGPHEPVFAVHRDNTWARPFTTADFARIAAITPTRQPRWSDVDPSWPDAPLYLYGPSRDELAYASFVAAAGCDEVAHATRALPLDDDFAEIGDQPFAAAWLLDVDARAHDLRIVAHGEPIYVDVWAKPRAEAASRHARDE